MTKSRNTRLMTDLCLSPILYTQKLMASWISRQRTALCKPSTSWFFLECSLHKTQHYRVLWQPVLYPLANSKSSKVHVVRLNISAKAQNYTLIKKSYVRQEFTGVTCKYIHPQWLVSWRIGAWVVRKPHVPPLYSHAQKHIFQGAQWDHDSNTPGEDYDHAHINSNNVGDAYKRHKSYAGQYLSPEYSPVKDCLRHSWQKNTDPLCTTWMQGHNWHD